MTTMDQTNNLLRQVVARLDAILSRQSDISQQLTGLRSDAQENGAAVLARLDALVTLLTPAETGIMAVASIPGAPFNRADHTAHNRS